MSYKSGLARKLSCKEKNNCFNVYSHFYVLCFQTLCNSLTPENPIFQIATKLGKPLMSDIATTR